MRRLFWLVIALVIAGAACSDSGETTTSIPPTDPPASATSQTTSPAAAATTAAPASPTTEPETDAPPDGGVTGPEDVVFPTADGIDLEGRVFGGGDTWFVLAHMRPADMESWFETAEFLAGQGFTALTFNFRGYGESGGDGFAVDVDMEAAVDHALANGAARVFTVGASMGGTAAVEAAVTREVAGVVTLSAPGVFEGVDALGAAALLEVPLIAISGADDQPYAGTADEMVAGAGSSAELLLFDGSAHGTDLLGEHSDEIHMTLVDMARGLY